MYCAKFLCSTQVHATKACLNINMFNMKMSNVVYNETTLYNCTVTVFFNNLKNSYVTATIAEANL